MSLPSLEIITAPFGIPTSAPVDLRLTVVDAHRISLSWERGPFPNGRILSYVLRISEVGSNENSALRVCNYWFMRSSFYFTIIQSNFYISGYSSVEQKSFLYVSKFVAFDNLHSQYRNA